MAVPRNTWQYKTGSYSGSSSLIQGGLRWRITNSEADAIANNRTIIEFGMWFKRTASTSINWDVNATSYHRYKIGTSSAVTKNIITQYDFSYATTGTRYYPVSANYLSSGKPVIYTSGSATNTFTINHNADGTPAATVLTTYFNGNGNPYLESITTTETITGDLPTIARGSILGDIDNFSINTTDAITIPITKRNSSYYDRLIIKLGSTTIKTINNISNNYSLVWSAAEVTTIKSLMDSPSAKFTFALSTYTTTAYTTQIGETSTKYANGSTLDMILLDSYNKTETGYQYCINGLVDTTKEDGLQLGNENGNSVVYGEVKLYPASGNMNVTSGNVELTEAATNFKYIEIFFRPNISDVRTFSSVKLYMLNEESGITLQSQYDTGTYLYMFQEEINISGTTLIRGTQTRWRFSTSPGIVRATGNYMYIARVVGYR